jgi:hypothetical protein
MGTGHTGARLDPSPEGTSSTINLMATEKYQIRFRFQ